MENKILFIYNNPLDAPYGGSRRTKKAFDGLSKFFTLEPYFCGKKSNKVKTLFRNLFLYSGGLSQHDCKRVIELINENHFVAIYFDVSIHGRLVKELKRKFPNLKIIVNYHNCERKYFNDLYKHKGILYYPVYKAASYNEKLSTKYSDFKVFITKEDREAIGRKNVQNSIIVPALLDDYFDEKYKSIKTEEPYILFLGNAAHANIEGAEFLITKILPAIDTKCIVAGTGMKEALSKYERTKNLTLLGYVEDLSELLAKAYAFVCPLYTGSGAKIKVAEALMFGKKIIGTPLNFFGYEVEKISSCIICETADDFITAIKGCNKNQNYYGESRKLFLSKYSNAQLETYYKPILDFLNKPL